MLKSYLKIALRHLATGRLYAFINLAGLSIGTAVVILLVLYVHDEWTFDRFHQNSGRTYRAWAKEHAPDNVFFNTFTPYILGQELRDNFPEIEQVARYLTINSQVKKGNFSEQENLHVVEPQFLKMFDFQLLRGKPEQVLEGIHSAVVTEEMGKKYFGDPYPIGQTLTMQVGGGWVDFTVTGVIEKAPGNSSFQYDILIPFENTKTFMSEGGRRSTCLLITDWADFGKKDPHFSTPFPMKKDSHQVLKNLLNGKLDTRFRVGQHAGVEEKLLVVGSQDLNGLEGRNDYPGCFHPERKVNGPGFLLEFINGLAGRLNFHSGNRDFLFFCGNRFYVQLPFCVDAEVGRLAFGLGIQTKLIWENKPVAVA